MIKIIFNLLQFDDFLIGDPDIDIAKGINKLPLTYKEAFKLGIRKIKTLWRTR